MALPISAPAPASMIVPSLFDRAAAGPAPRWTHRNRLMTASGWGPPTTVRAARRQPRRWRRAARRDPLRVVRKLTMQARSTGRPSSSVVVMKARPSRCTRSATPRLSTSTSPAHGGRYLKQVMLSGPVETSSKSRTRGEPRAQRAGRARCRARSDGRIRRADLLQDHPQLQRPEAARLLHRELAEPRQRGIVAKVGRHEAEGVAHRLRRRGRWRSRIRPGCRATCAGRCRGCRRARCRRTASASPLGEHRDAAVGGIDVQPQVLAARRRRQSVERIDGAGVDGARAGDDRDRPMSAVQSPTNRHGRTRMKARTSAEGDGHG